MKGSYKASAIRARNLVPSLTMAALITIATSGWFATASAQAEPDYEFTPRLENLSFSTYGAGASPEMSLAIDKIKNRCVPYAKPCPAENFHWQQNLKRIVMTLPNGFLANANAREYCNAKLEDVFGIGIPYWICNPESWVGSGEITLQECNENENKTEVKCTKGSGQNDPEIFAIWRVDAYNEKAKNGEQGRIRLLYQSAREFGYSVGLNTTEMSVKVREPVTSDIRIDVVADDIPDYLNENNKFVAGQMKRIELDIDGSIGTESGFPLLENSRVCAPDGVEVLFQGYEFNSYNEPAYPWTLHLGSGNGKEVSDSTPYQSTGCENLPFTPTFGFSRDTSGAGQAPAITTSISQTDDQATIKEVKVLLPEGTGANLNSTVTPCPADALAQGSCPESSKLGTGSANSRFLPVGDGPLTGNVYLTEIRPDGRFGLSMLLDGFISLRIDGEAGLVNDRFEVKFTDLPPVPMSGFTLSLNGGNGGLLTNPRRCGSGQANTTFTSHTGATHATSSSVEVTGCDRPSFDVELSERGRGKRTSVELDVSAQGEDVESVSFGLPRHLKVNEAKLGKASYGALTTVSERGTVTRKLRKGKRTKGISARRRKKSKKASSKKSALKLGAGSSFGSFSASIFKKKVDTGKTIKVRGKRRKVKATKQRMSLKSLPSDSLSRVGVELNPDERSFIRTPRLKSCKRPLKFLAFVRTNRSYYVVKDEVKLRCGKKRKKSLKKK